VFSMDWLDWLNPFKKEPPEQLKEKIVFFLSEAKSCIQVTLRYLNKGKLKKAIKWTNNAVSYLNLCEIEISKANLQKDRCPVLYNTIKWAKKLPVKLQATLISTERFFDPKRKDYIKDAIEDGNQLLIFIDMSLDEINKNL